MVAALELSVIAAMRPVTDIEPVEEIVEIDDRSFQRGHSVGVINLHRLAFDFVAPCPCRGAHEAQGMLGKRQNEMRVNLAGMNAALYCPALELRCGPEARCGTVLLPSYLFCIIT